MGGTGRTHDAYGAGFVAATLALAACGTTLPDGVDGPPPTTNDGDASVVAETSSPSTLDAGGDTQIVLDGGGGDGPDAACPRAIDEPFDQIGSWTTTMQNGGTVAVPAIGGNGGGNALRAEVFANGSSTAAQVSREIAGPMPKSIRLAFAMRVASTNAKYAELGCTLQLQAADADTFVSFQPEISGGNLAFDSAKKDDGSDVSTGSAAQIGTLDTNHWYAVDVVLDAITGAGGNVKARVDGTPRYDRAATFPAPPELIRVKCGIDFGADGASAAVLVDDVVLELCP